MLSSGRKEVKVTLLGLSQTGKTTLFNRVVYDEFIKTSVSLSAYFGMIIVAGIEFALWDTAGQEKFYALTQFYLRDSGITILVVDPTVAQGFEKQLEYLDGMLKSPEASHNLLLVAIKKDLVTPENQAAVEANIDAFHKKFASETDPKPLFVSAKDENTKSLILDQMVRLIKCNNILNEDPQDKSIMERLKAIDRKLKKRFFKPDTSRSVSIQRLMSALENCKSQDEIKNVLIDEARFLRTPDENGRLKYGINLGFSRFFMHFRGYEHSEFYQFLKSELRRIDRKLDLAKESDPKTATVAAVPHLVM
jgi:small GTP-binding protein